MKKKQKEVKAVGGMEEIGQAVCLEMSDSFDNPIGLGDLVLVSIDNGFGSHVFVGEVVWDKDQGCAMLEYKRRAVREPLFLYSDNEDCALLVLDNEASDEVKSQVLDLFHPAAVTE